MRRECKSKGKREGKGGRREVRGEGNVKEGGGERERGESKLVFWY